MSLGGRRWPSGLEMINKIGNPPSAAKGGSKKTHFPNAKALSRQSKEKISSGQCWCGSKSSMFVCAPQVIRSIIAHQKQQQQQSRTWDSRRERAGFPLKRARAFHALCQQVFPAGSPPESFTRATRERAENCEERESINRHARTLAFQYEVQGNPLGANSWSPIAKVAAPPALMTSPNGKLSQTFSDQRFALKTQLSDHISPWGSHPIRYDPLRFEVYEIFPGTHTRFDPDNLSSVIWMNIAFSHRLKANS